MGLALAAGGLAAGLLLAAAAGDPAPRDWDELPAFVWRPPGRPPELPPAWRAAFGGLNLERAEELPPELRGEVTYYVGHGPGRDALHLERDSGEYPARRAAWLESGDTRHLVRDPCLTDPATRAALRDELERTLAARGGRHGVGVSLGDEVSLTPWGDPVDLCRSPTCEAAWAAWLGADGARAPFPDTDGARRALARGDLAPLGPWLERRRFAHEVVAGVLDELAALSRELAPTTPVGLLGLTGRTPFGGVGVDRLLPRLDFLEAYPTGDARELLFTLRAPAQRALATIILEDSSPASCAWRVWEHWLRGGDGWIVYRARDLERWPAHAEAVAEAIGAARAVQADLRARGFVEPPRPSGVALVHSDDSAALAWLRDAALDGPTWPNRLAGFHARNGTREASTLTWLRLLEDLGRLPGSLPAARVGAGTAERFPLLVLDAVEVLDDAELAGLEAHLLAGGHVLVDGPAGTFDGDGARRAEPAARRWAEAWPARVHAAPEGLERYRRTRLRGAGERSSAAAVGALLDELAGAPPVRVRSRPDLPWLVTLRERADGALAVAALPGLQTEADRRSLAAAELSVTLDAPEGWSVEWLRPAGAPVAARPAREPIVAVLTPPRD